MKLLYYIGCILLGLVIPFNGFCQKENKGTKDSSTISRQDSVNIAYGKQTKESVTGAISSINAGTIRQNGLTNISQALPGTLPGLITTMSAGNTIAADDYSFLIRGKATNANTNPLVFVDNVERSLEYLDPNEIESVTILKDVSAQVMYGLRGANGVILITTKRGDKDNDYINLDIRTGLQSSEFWAPRLNAFQYGTLYNEGLTNDGRTAFYSNKELEGYRNNAANPYVFPDVDFRSELLKKQAPIQNYNFSAGGGNDKLRYFTALGYLNQGGFLKFTDKNDKFSTQNKFERFNFRTNLDLTLTEGFEVGLDVGAIITNRHSPWTNPNNILKDINNTPANAYPLFNEDGSLGGTINYQDNLYGEITSSGYRNDQTRSLQTTFRMSKTLDFITKNLSLNGNYSIDNLNPYVTGQSRDFAVFELDTAKGTPAVYTQHNADSKLSSKGYAGSDYFRRNVLNLSLNYANSFSNLHSINAILLYHQSRLNTEGDNPDWKYQSISSRITYGFKNKYFAEVAASYSGSSNFTKGNKMGLFPAVSGAWIVSKEDFMKEGKVIDFLKVRASAGEVGNDRISGDRYQYKQTSAGGGGYGFGIPNGTSPGSTLSALGNPQISWETAFKTNVGFDVQLYKNSIALTFDYFYERRRDIAVPQSSSVPAIIGTDLPNENAGVVLNRGFDFDLRFNHRFNDLNLFAGFNGVLAKNKVVDLGEPLQAYEYLYRKGHSLDARFGLVANGIYQNTGEITNGPTSSYSLTIPGDIRYVNQNPGDDNIIDAKDRVVIGKGSIPEFYYGINFGGAYKAFDFSFLFQGAGARDILFVPSQYSEEFFQNRWTADGASVTTYPRITSVTSGHNNTQGSTFWQRKGNYLRFKSVELGYTFNRILSVKAVRLYLNGANLATFSGLDNLDPEDQRAGYIYAPLARTYTFGIKVSM